MKITLDRLDNDFLFEATNERGDTIRMDNGSRADGNVNGAGPMEVLLMGVAGCSAIDIIHILKKQKQEITSYHVEADGQREKVGGANPFKKIHVKVYLEGDISGDKALRAAALSFEKYCSVSLSLDKSIELTYSVVLNGEEL